MPVDQSPRFRSLRKSVSDDPELDVVVSGVSAESIGIAAAGGKLTDLFPIVPIIAICALSAWVKFLGLSRSCNAVRFCPGDFAVHLWHGFCLILRLEIWPLSKEEFPWMKF